MRIHIPREDAVRGLLEAGTYGEGLEHNAVVEVTNFTYGAECPPFDKDGARAPWAKITVRVLLETGESHLLDTWREASRVKSTFIQMGVPFEEGSDKSLDFDTDQIVGAKLRGVEVDGPRQAANGNTYNGNLRSFIS